MVVGLYSTDLRALVALCDVVRLGAWVRALGGGPVAGCGLGAVLLSLAEHPVPLRDEPAVGAAAGSLGGRALRPSLPRAPPLLVLGLAHFGRLARVAALLGALVLVEATVALKKTELIELFHFPILLTLLYE